MRQLAYAGEDGRIRVLDLDLGTDVEISPLAAPGEDTVCAWPTWSPDGNRLGFFRYRVSSGEVRAAAVCVGSLDGAATREVCALGTAGPIYMGWSPDGERLALLVQESNELYLRIVDARGERPVLTVLQGAPLYFVWQPDSRGLVANVGAGASRTGTARIVWIRLEGGDATRESVARLPAPGFRAPAWSTRLAAPILAFERGDGAELVVLTGPDAAATTLVETGNAPAFVWSPAGDVLAFAARPSAEMGLYQGISAYRADEQSTQLLTEDPALAFFWSPDGQRLLYMAGEADSRLVRVRQIDVASRVQSDLGWVRPSRDVLLLLSHFDQYAQSAQLLSADGSSLLLAASRAKETENGSVPTVRQILLCSLSEAGVESVVGRGRFACWRPTPRVSE